ncbi:DUF898 family protein [Radicibacter daui]|uniref:DUF898 family protein n=1 Tax=Radicibacter daui TaxID=3064829 RepID=UPI004046A22D
MSDNDHLSPIHPGSVLAVQPEGPRVDGPLKRVLTRDHSGQIYRTAFWGSFLLFPTLGFYQFWQKTRLRSLIWSSVELDGDAFEYTGRPMELLIGFMVAMVILVPLAALNQYVAVFISDSLVQTIRSVVAALVLGWLYGFALLSHRRYLASRTRWRGIRFSQRGSRVQSGFLVVTYGFLSVLSLGIAAPYLDMAYQRFVWNDTWFGDERFTFQGQGKALIGPWLACLLLAIPSLGLSLFYYSGVRLRYLLDEIRLGDMRFPSAFSKWMLFKAAFFFALVAIFSGVLVIAMIGVLLGLNSTVVPTGMANIILNVILVTLPVVFYLSFLRFCLFRFMVVPVLIETVRKGTLEGMLDLSSIGQSQFSTGYVGEGVASALDVGAF